MALKYFEKDFTYDFYPLREDRCTYEVLPAAPVSVYLYDGRPSEEDAATGANGSGYSVIETVLAWNDTDDGQGKRISFAAVAEPADFDGVSRKYYVVVNTALTNPIPPIIKEVTFKRLASQESIIDISLSDILGIEPQIELFCNKQGRCVGEVERYVDAAVKELKIKVTTCNLDYSNLPDPAEIEYAASLLAISKFFFGQSREVGDVHWGNGLRYDEKYGEMLKATGITIDEDGDGSPDGQRQASSGILSLRVRR